MKSLMKLAFVALLAGCVLALPRQATAISGCYTCNSGPMGACMLSAQQWMSQCVSGCPPQGSPEELCYEGLICGGNPYECNPAQFCGDYPSSGISCVQSCINQMDNLVNSCTNANCTPGC
jgi:hypothetical protein